MDDVNLPNGWMQATIDDLVGIHGVFRDGDWVESKDQDQNGEVRLIQLADIGDSEFRDKSSRFLTSDKAAELKCTFLEYGDVLVARMPDPLGRACLFPLHGNSRFVTVVDVCVIRFGHDLVNEKYFMYALNSPMSRRNISDHQTGSTRKRISRGNLSTVQFPIAPLHEQHRIVAKIEELFSELDKGIENLKTAQAQLKVYRQALLKHAFEGKLTAQWRAENRGKLETADALLKRIQQERELRYQQQLADWEAAGKQGGKPKAQKPLPSLSAEVLAELPKLPEGWGWVRLDEISDHITDGDHQAPPQTKDGIPFITISDIKDQKIDFSDTRYVSKSYFDNLSPMRKPVKDDILYTVTGSFGVPCLVDFDRDFCFQRHIGLIRSCKSISKKFLFYALSTRHVYGQAASVATGTAQKTVPLGGLRLFIIPLMAFEEQQQIAVELECRLSEVDQLELTITTSLRQAEALRQSILKKAFSGRLVPQDLHDEPATALLERTRAGREQSHKPKREREVTP